MQSPGTTPRALPVTLSTVSRATPQEFLDLVCARLAHDPEGLRRMTYYLSLARDFAADNAAQHEAITASTPPLRGPTGNMIDLLVDVLAYSAPEFVTDYWERIPRGPSFADNIRSYFPGAPIPDPSPDVDPQDYEASAQRIAFAYALFDDFPQFSLPEWWSLDPSAYYAQFERPAVAMDAETYDLGVNVGALQVSDQQWARLLDPRRRPWDNFAVPCPAGGLRPTAPVPTPGGTDVQETDVCSICTTRACIPADLMAVLRDDLETWEGTAEAAQSAQGSLAYTRKVRADLQEFRRTRKPPAGSLLERALRLLGNEFSVEDLMRYIRGWADNPMPGEFYRAYFPSMPDTCRLFVCDACLRREHEDYLVGSDRSRRPTMSGQTIRFPYVELAEGVPSRSSTAYGRFINPLVGRGTEFDPRREVTQIAPYQPVGRPMLQPPERIQLAATEAAYQIPWSWFDSAYGPYAIEGGALVYYRTETENVPIGTLALGLLQEYDTDHFDEIQGQGRDSVGQIPTRVVVTPMLPFFGPDAVESVRVDNVFPLDVTIPSIFQVYDARGENFVNAAGPSEGIAELFEERRTLQDNVARLGDLLADRLPVRVPTAKERTRLTNLLNMARERLRYIEETTGASGAQRMERIASYVAREQQRRGSSRALRAVGFAPFAGLSQEAALQSAVGRIPGVTPVPLSVRVAAPPISPEREGRVSQPGAAELGEREKLNIIYRVAVTKLLANRARTWHFRPAFPDRVLSRWAYPSLSQRAAILTASILGVETHMRGVVLPEPLDQWASGAGARDPRWTEQVPMLERVATAWDSIFAQAGPEGDPEKYAFPGYLWRGTQRRVGQQYAGRSFSPEQAVSDVFPNVALDQRGTTALSLYQHVLALLGRYEWFVLYGPGTDRPPRDHTPSEDPVVDVDWNISLVGVRVPAGAPRPPTVPRLRVPRQPPARPAPPAAARPPPASAARLTGRKRTQSAVATATTQSSVQQTAQAQGFPVPEGWRQSLFYLAADPYDQTRAQVRMMNNPAVFKTPQGRWDLAGLRAVRTDASFLADVPNSERDLLLAGADPAALMAVPDTDGLVLRFGETVPPNFVLNPVRAPQVRNVRRRVEREPRTASPAPAAARPASFATGVVPPTRATGTTFLPQPVAPAASVEYPLPNSSIVEWTYPLSDEWFVSLRREPALSQLSDENLRESIRRYSFLQGGREREEEDEAGSVERPKFGRTAADLRSRSPELWAEVVRQVARVAGPLLSSQRIASAQFAEQQRSPPRGEQRQ